MKTVALLVQLAAALPAVFGLCNLPLEVRLAAYDEWFATVSAVQMMSHQYSRNSLLTNDKIVSTAADRMMNYTLMVPTGSYSAVFKITHYSGSNTGFIGSLYYNGQLLTQTGQPGWNITTTQPNMINGAEMYNYVSTPDWAPVVSCTAPPATINAFNQSFPGFMTKYNSSAPQPQWIAPGGNCVNATAPLTYWVRVTFTLSTSLTTCPYSFTNPTLMGINPYYPWGEYRIGAQTAPKTLQVRTTGIHNYVAYLGNYTVASQLDYMINAQNQVVYYINYGHLRVTDYKVQVDTSPQVVAVALNEIPVPDGWRGFIATILYENQIVAVTGELSGWKVTSDPALVRPGWNWDYNYDTTGWSDPTPEMLCPRQADGGFVQPYVSDLGVCSQYVGYPNCSVHAPISYYRYAFDPKAFVARPQLLCQDVSGATCAAGKFVSASALNCYDCPIGTYKYSSGNTACTTCPATMSTNTTGSTTCTCAPGFGWTGSICSSCAANSFKLTSSNATCTSCLTPEFASCTSSSFSCSAGHTVSADGLQCIPCPIGTYKATPGNAQCTPCPLGATTATNSSISSASCQCPAGFGWDGTACNSCLLTSSYKANSGNAACTACPSNATCTSTAFTCFPGYTLSADNISCVPCAVGTYKSMAGNGQCSTCAALGATTASDGSTQASSCQCPAGFGWDGVNCLPCMSGTYKPGMNNSACTACPVASACNSTAFQCNAGFSPSPNGLSCDPCPLGSYKQGSNNGQCSVCPSSSTTVSNGTSSVAGCQCIPGYAWDGAQCTQCSLGTYKDTMGNTGCTNCTDLSTTFNLGSDSAESCLCQPGYEWDGFVCSKCPTGKFKKDYGNFACVTCPRNAICTATKLSCAIGYTPSADGWLCIQCASGTYKDSVGTGECMPCPAGSLNAQCSDASNLDGNVVDSQSEQGKLGTSTTAVTNNGITLSTATIGIFVAAGLVLCVIVAVVILRLYPRITAKRNGAQAPNNAAKTVVAEEFTKAVLQTSTFYSKSHVSTYMGATTMLVNNTEFAMPGFLQLQAGKDFRWETPLAKGGGGEVFSGRGFTQELCKQNGGALVVKIVAPARSAVSLKTSQAFDQEIAVMHYLGRHRNISQLLGWCEEPLAIVMKLYQLGTLTTFIKSGFLETKGQVALFALDICKAVQFMHSKSVAHRDIKADNVFIDLDDDGAAVCVLGDFGIANIFSRQAELVDGFQVVNLNGLTISYSAPEVIRRFRARDNACSVEDAFQGDVYSTAMLLYLLQCKLDAWSA